MNGNREERATSTAAGSLLHYHAIVTEELCKVVTVARSSGHESNVKILKLEILEALFLTSNIIPIVNIAFDLIRPDS